MNKIEQYVMHTMFDFDTFVCSEKQEVETLLSLAMII